VVIFFRRKTLLAANWRGYDINDNKAIKAKSAACIGFNILPAFKRRVSRITRTKKFKNQNKTPPQNSL
jgi:hypothetical protein